MARSLESLQKQYNSSSKNGKPGMGGMGGPGGGPRGGHRGPGGPGGPGGKPKNLKKTVKRLLSYVGKHKIKLALVLICMLFNTLANVCPGVFKPFCYKGYKP